MAVDPNPLDSNSYNPTDNASFTTPAKKVAKVKSVPIKKASIKKLTTTVKMPKSSGGVKGFAMSTKMGAKSIRTAAPKAFSSKLPSPKPAKYVSG